MPRKKDEMPFEVHPSPKNDVTGERLLYPVPARGRKLTMKELESYCEQFTGLRHGELTRAFDVFREVSLYWLRQGYRIETSIGTFVPKLRMKQGVRVSDTELVKHDDVELQSIECDASADYENELRDRIRKNGGFRYVRTPDSSQLLTNLKHLEQALQESIKSNNGFTTVQDFAYRSGLSAYSARKQLNEWCKGPQPKLLRTRWGHSDIYTET